MFLKLNSFLRIAVTVLGMVIMMGTLPSRAATVAVTGGTTTVFLTSELLLNSLDVGGVWIDPLGTATITPGPVSELSLAITGGSLDTTTGDLILEHEGSGFQLSDSSNEVNLNDLIINTLAGTVSATVTGDFGGPVGPTNETVFNIFLSLFLVTTPSLDAILAGLSPVVPDGFTFGIQTNAEVTAIPLPAALPLLAGALSLMGFLGWRRKRVAVA